MYTEADYKKPVVAPEMVSLYKSFTEKFTDGYQNIPLQNLVFITDKLNHVPFRIHRINYFQVFFKKYIYIKFLHFQKSSGEFSMINWLVFFKRVFNYCVHNLGNLCRSYLIVATGGNVTACVCVCVCFGGELHTHSVTHRHVVWLVGVFCPGGADSQA